MGVRKSVKNTKRVVARGSRRAPRDKPPPTASLAAEAESLCTILLVSDGSGVTCSHVLNAALTQFEKPPVRVLRRVNMRTPDEATAVVEEAYESCAIILYTLMDERIRETLHEAANRRLVPTVDLLGPVLSAVAGLLRTPPTCDPRLINELERKYVDRIDAVDFTLAHDDGMRIQELTAADVVLVGVSRVSKSATCFVLACRGIRAANVPLVPGTEPPRELAELDPQKVIGLTASVFRLQSMREARIQSMRMGEVESYVNPREIASELRFAQSVMEKHRWRVIDVSFKAVEEVAREVLRMIGREN